MPSLAALSIRGTPVRLHWSLLLFPVLLLALDLAGLRALGSVGAEAVSGVILFASVALHELGHVVAARRFGVPAHSITLHIIGGHARMERPLRGGVEELGVALAGPAVNMCVGIGLLAAIFAGALPTGGIATEIAVINLAIALFNMLPLMPLDGGRALRATFTFVMDRPRATSLAGSIGVLMAAALVSLGVEYGLPLLSAVALALGIASYIEVKAVEQLAAREVAARSALRIPPARAGGR